MAFGFDDIAALIFGGLQAYGATQDKPETKQVSKLTGRQKEALKVLMEQAMARLGRWEDTPEGGRQFVYDPQRPPEYPGQVAAPLTDLQQQGIQDASNLGQLLREIMTQGPRDYTGMLAQYQPGKIREMAANMPRSPTLGDQPYQFNPMALSGMAPPRPEIPPTTTPPFKKPKKGKEPTTKSSPLTFPFGAENNMMEVLKNLMPSFAAGGYMPDNQPSSVNLVGEAGPEMHVGQTGQRNMVGEHGPELFDPNQGGQIIPNKALPAPMQAGVGPQANTGQEMPLPGQAGGGQGDGTQDALNSIAVAMIQPAMTLAGAGRQQGGPTDNYNYQWGDAGAMHFDVPEGMSEYWQPGENDDYLGQFDFGGDVYQVPRFDDPAQAWDWSMGDWNQIARGFENVGGNPYGIYTMGSPEGYMAGPAEGEGLPYYGMVGRAPGVGAKEPTAPYGPGAGTTEGFDWSQMQPYDPNLLPQMTWQERLSYEHPEYYNFLTETMGRTEPYYTYDPAAIRGEWETSIYEPGMDIWQQDIQPIIEESYAQTGNVYGGRRPRGVSRALNSYVTNMNAEYGKMLTEGRVMEADAYKTLAQNRLAAGQQYGAMADLPMQAMHTQALIDNINVETQTKAYKMPIEIQQSLSNVDLTNASVDAVYDQMTTNPLISDKMAIENMVSLAYLDTMGTTRMGQELRNIGQALTNAGITMAIGGEEQDVVQMLLTYSWNDWVNALGPDYENATNSLLAMIGMPVVENFAMIPQATDFSWLGQYLASRD